MFSGGIIEMISRSRSSIRAATSGSDSGEKKRARSLFRSGTGGTGQSVPSGWGEEVDDEFGYPTATQRKSLDNDQRLWRAWMASRSAVSALLPEEEKSVYDNCTETLYRYKLIMLENRYENPDNWSDPESRGLLVFD